MYGLTLGNECAGGGADRVCGRLTCYNYKKGVFMYLKEDFFGYSLVMYNQNKQRMHYDPNDRDYTKDAKFRAKRKVVEYALNNDFNWFVTITFDKIR